MWRRRKVGTEGGRGSLFVRRREQPGLQIATIRDTKEGNASDTMHACSGIVGCQCREGAMSILLTGATRFRLLRKCRPAHVGKMPPCFSASFGCRIRCAGVCCGTTQFPNGCIVRCNIRCLVKTQILPRSEVTMEVRRCQCAYRRVHMQRRAAQARR